MIAQFKILIQLLMVVLTLGIYLPEPVCAMVIPVQKMECCCQPGQACACQPIDSCASTCIAAQASTSDKSAPLIPSFNLHARVNVPLFILANSPQKLLSDSVNFSPDFTDFPPCGGSPPQAILRLWLL